MTYIIFALVTIILAGIARLMKLTYNTINILVYYLLIPLSWAYMGDKIIDLEYSLAHYRVDKCLACNIYNL